MSNSILYVMAAKAEYGEHLQKRVAPVITGVGPVEAAISVTRVLSEAFSAGGPPKVVVSLGSAGSATLEHAGIYQASSVSYRDMNAEPLGFAKGITPFLELPAELILRPLVPGLRSARLSTGANVVSGSAYGQIAADMVDMESYAVTRACQSFQVPVLVIRGISDGRSNLKGLQDWTEYLHIIDQKLSKTVDAIERYVQDRF